jgi:exodeoxyribonuclease VII small subunit
MENKNHTFEENMHRLEQIIRVMERGEASLEESLKLFMEGTELVSVCEKLLEQADLQVKKVMAAADGSPVFEEFIDDGE